MRKNTQDTFKAWQAGRKFNGGGASIWTDGEDIFSYATRIVTREGQRVLFNQEKYSATTSNHQNSLRMLMAQNGIGWEHMDNN